MNNQGEISDKWADGVYSFRLPVARIIELEQKCDAPFGVIFARVVSGSFKVSDIIETIRLGLIGAGLSPAKALTLVEDYGLPLSENLPIAKAILAGAMFGFEASPLGKQTAAPEGDLNASTPPPSPEQPFSLGSVLRD